MPEMASSLEAVKRRGGLVPVNQQAGCDGEQKDGRLMSFEIVGYTCGDISHYKEGIHT